MIILQFNFSTELFNERVSNIVLVSAKRTVEPVLGMKYQHSAQHPSVIKYFKETFNLRPPFLKLLSFRDVETMFEYILSIEDNNTISYKPFSQRVLILLLLLRG